MSVLDRLPGEWCQRWCRGYVTGLYVDCECGGVERLRYHQIAEVCDAGFNLLPPIIGIVPPLAAEDQP